MKNWQVLIGLMAIAVAILISGILISNAIQEAGSNIHVGFLWVSSLDNYKPMRFVQQKWLLRCLGGHFKWK